MNFLRQRNRSDQAVFKKNKCIGICLVTGSSCVSWEGSAVFSILLREVPKHERVQDTPTRRHIYPRFFLLDPSGCFTWRNRFFFATRSGRRSLHAHSICDATCTSENKWDVSDIFIRSIRFLEIVLVRLRNEKPDVSHFFYPIHPIYFLTHKCVTNRVRMHSSYALLVAKKNLLRQVKLPDGSSKKNLG